MLSKDFENYELHLKKLSEEARDFFEKSQKIFEESYMQQLNFFLPQDIMGASKRIRAFFCITATEFLREGKILNIEEIFASSVKKVCGELPLMQDMKQLLSSTLIGISQNQNIKTEHLILKHDFSRDPFFPMLQDIFADGRMSQEEFLLLQQHYKTTPSLQKNLEHISPTSKKNISQEISQMHLSSLAERKNLFLGEYAGDIASLEQRGYQTSSVVDFVSRTYYKPNKRFETPEKRLRRTWKMALLKLLRLKFGSVNIELLLKRFESCSSFEDFFLLLYKLFEIVEEEQETQESFYIQEKKDTIEDIFLQAEERKDKILAGEKVTAHISHIISEADTTLEQGVLEKILDTDTHFLGGNIHFSHGVESAGIYAQIQKEREEKELEDEEIKEIIESDDTLQGKYEALKIYFFELDEAKRKAFLLGDYEEIDRINDKLIRLDSQIQKLSLLLGEEFL